MFIVLYTYKESYLTRTLLTALIVSNSSGRQSYMKNLKINQQQRLENN